MLSRMTSMLSKMTLVAVTATLAMGLAVFPAHAQNSDDTAKTAKAPERECKTETIIRTGGSARTLIFARKKARDAWRQKVKRKFGRQWTAWPYAKNPEYSCRNVGKGRKRCRISATPCKLKVVLHGPHKVCSFYKIQGTGPESRLKEWAKHKARKVWAQRVRGFYGKKFDTWLLSNNKETNCKDTGNGSYKCSVVSQPCRFYLVK